MEGDVDVGNGVEELGPEGGLVHGLVLAVAADQGHLGGGVDKMLVGHKLILSPAAPHRIKDSLEMERKRYSSKLQPKILDN